MPMGDDLVRFLATGHVQTGSAVPLASVRLRAPVPRPGKVICVGLNYRDHAEESGQPIPDEPVLFAKFANSVTGPGEPIAVPPAVEQPDYEAELGVVIGREAHRVDERSALEHVAGYTCVNDVSARDLQFRSSQWLLGKAIDGFPPMGPWLVTPTRSPIRRRFGSGARSAARPCRTPRRAQMIFGVAELIAFVTRTISLEPGDVIATGTPPGVGMARTPPRWLRDGDEVTVEIERIGALTNAVRMDAPMGGTG